MSTKSPGLRLEVTTGDTGARCEAWRDAKGRRQDPPDGTPAVRWYYADGEVEVEEHWQDGQRQDPASGAPAVRWYRPDGTVEVEMHWQDGQRQDPADGSPAVRWHYADGTVEVEMHYQAGEYVQEDQR